MVITHTLKLFHALNPSLSQRGCCFIEQLEVEDEFRVYSSPVCLHGFLWTWVLSYKRTWSLAIPTAKQLFSGFLMVLRVIAICWKTRLVIGLCGRSKNI